MAVPPGRACSRATPRRPRPRPRPLQRWPGGFGYIEPVQCCACPAQVPEPVTDGELYEFETLELETPAGMPTLRLGSRGAAVVDLQRRLAAAGFSAGPADGIFGSRTDGAVRSFQRARGLKVDGVVGPLTWGALLGTPAAPAPQPRTGHRIAVGPAGDGSVHRAHLRQCRARAQGHPACGRAHARDDHERASHLE